MLPVVSAGHQVQIYLTGEGDHRRGEVEANQGVARGKQRLERLEAGLASDRLRLVQQREAETGQPGQHQTRHREAGPDIRTFQLFNSLLRFDFLSLLWHSAMKTDFDQKGQHKFKVNNGSTMLDGTVLALNFWVHIFLFASECQQITFLFPH